MKRCPECRRDYYDDTLLYCLDDGNALLEGPRSEPGAVATGFSADEPQTAILHSTAAPGEAPTRAQINTTDATAILHTGAEAEPRESLGGLPERQSLSPHRAAKPLAAGVVALLVLVGGFFGYRYFSIGGSSAINSIAVMPFENRNSDADTDYLSDGLAESVIFRLTQIPDLRVSPTSSVMRYKGASTDIAKIASELGVDAVMTGRLTKRGDNLNITVELVDVRTNKSLWGEQYERKLSELLTTQREIVAEIVNKLQLKLSGESEQKLAKKYTVNPEAYQAYLKGRYYWNKRTGENIKKAIEQFNLAVEKDPNYALAYVGLADCYALGNEHLQMSVKESVPQAKAYATKALELDGSLGEAYATLGMVNHLLWNWAESEKAYKRSIELNPNYATSRHWYSRLLSDLRRQDEALAEIKRANELDPLSPVIIVNIAQRYQEMGEYQSAFDYCNKALEIDPTFAGMHYNIASIYVDQKRSAEALAEAEKDREYPGTLVILGMAYAQNGKRNEALAVIKQLEERFAKGDESASSSIANVYVELGEKEKTFEWLEKAFQVRDLGLTWLRIGPTFAPIRDDPRYKDLLKRMNLPE